ncbi:hypothetical protein P168DRAFT_95428 [Aspergillus campestris IBT 28561]|uniref:Uncharacterized protein n=1 Tax=Aspergillus campestris (strain IBT 28561) TaxID=1392248 RepID=A0A2I1DC20_ASPC2|nr:uncharacterized protein P168DRAFT_95428 [Aspergillus campestris IBT 28561]PKY07398.1 hypothetical protein P168DRAFT_95428 [Aspergillus campestris IBT 28561]
MVVFVDLENDGLDQNHFVENPHALSHPFPGPTKPAMRYAYSTSVAEHADRTPESPESRAMADQPDLNQSRFAAALSCYPIVKEIARAVDLNTMHALSRTCRRFHANLGPYRQQLSKITLRCESERVETTLDAEPLVRVVGSSAKVRRGKCARDMVAECRKCSKVVCRNCVAKPATNIMLKSRIRRLCTTCLTAPLSQLQPLASSCSTQSAVRRNICTCKVSIWLCQPCGQRLSSDDLVHRQMWSWRIRSCVSGNWQRLRCWRGKHCLAAQDVELVMGCDSHDSLTGGVDSFHGRNDAESPDEESWEDFRQDTAGIRFRLLGSYGEEGVEDLLRHIFEHGGPIEHTVRKHITVGAYTEDHEDERRTGEYLTREEAGLDRAWCNWCSRVTPSQHDLDVLQ